MPTLGVPRHHRQISRVIFYLGVALIFWVMGQLSPPAVSHVPTDEELGAARPLIASPEIPWYATLPQGR
ncbi:MAG: hypothetical protein JNK37_02285 [Verrucomicrobiales bacterium]|nr:hypothetical protein [Verrucomicrobiales bacterium]